MMVVDALDELAMVAPPTTVQPVNLCPGEAVAEMAAVVPSG